MTRRRAPSNIRDTVAHLTATHGGRTVSDDMGRIAKVLLAAISCAAGAAPTAGANPLLANVDGYARAAAYGGVTAVTVGGSPGPASLVINSGGRSAAVKIAPLEAGTRVDLGPGPNGHVWAVYSRCGDRRNTCDIYGLDVVTGRERRLTRVSSRNSDEFSPTIWRDRIAFTRIHHTRTSSRTRIYMGTLDGRLREIPRGPRGAGHYGPGLLDLRGSTLAYTWNYEKELCLDGDGQSLLVTYGDLYIATPTSRRRVAHGCASDRFGDPSSITLGPGSVYFAFHAFDADNAFLLHYGRMSLTTGEVRDVPFIFHYTRRDRGDPRFTQDGARTVETFDGQVNVFDFSSSLWP